MKQNTAQSIKQGSTHHLDIETLALGGKGIARIEDFTIFVERALPGQTVEAQIVKKKKNYAEARVVKIIDQSDLAVPARCSHFGVCGGCLFQNLDYSKQVEYKHKQVVETLVHLGGFQNLHVNSIIPSDDIYFYRNKMEFSFSDSRWLTSEEIETREILSEKNFALGLHVPRRFDKVLDIQECHLQSESSNRILSFIKEWTQKSQIPPYSIDHHGFWRFLIIREGKNTGQTMVNIVTSGEEKFFDKLTYLASDLITAIPEITTIVHTVNRKKAQIATGNTERILHGNGFILETLGAISYRISANSFFQTNSRQAERLYQTIVNFGEFKGGEIVYDLYCGAGTISLFTARSVKKILGIELVSQAIEDANINMERNHIDNCSFIQGDLKDSISSPQTLIQQYGKPDIVIVDPPRSGMHPDIPFNIMELSPEKIIYVSCNPATQARDLKVLCEQQYKIQKIQPVDMFPHTAHCEVIALLTRNN